MNRPKSALQVVGAEDDFGSGSFNSVFLASLEVLRV